MKKYTKAYQTYRDKFYSEKRIGNVKRGVRVLTANQYKRAVKEDLTNTDIIKAQTILKTKAEKAELWRYYKRTKKSFDRGEKLDIEGSYFGENIDEREGLGFHYNLSGLLKDKDAMHFIISTRINDGEDREEVLADYGY